MKRQIPPFPRLAGRLYLFPALIPLAEIVPWLLTAIGAAAGVAGWTGRVFSRTKLLAFGLACLIAAGGAVFYFMPDKEVRDNGTRLVTPDNIPVPVPAQPIDVKPAAPVTKFGERWSIAIHKQILSTPVIAQGVLLFGSYEGTIEALSAADGKALWSLPQSAPVFALSVDAKGIVYAGEGLHETAAAGITALQPTDGKVLWLREFLGHIEEPVTFDEEKNRLWTGTGPGGLWAVNKLDGSILWHAPIGHLDATALYTDDKLYVPAQPDENVKSSMLFALNADDGKIIWQTPVQGQPWGSPVTDGKTIWSTTALGQIGVNKDSDAGWAYAVSPADGKIIWEKKLPSMAIQPDVHLVQDGLIIYSIKTGDLVAINATDGSQKWSVKVGKEIQAPAVLLQGEGEPLIAVTTFDGVFSIRRALTGEEVARRELGKTSTSSPVADGDNVYVTTAHRLTQFSGIDALREAH